MSIVDEAQFLLDRLEEFERDLDEGDAFREYAGHVAPAAARLKSALQSTRLLPSPFHTGKE